MKKGDIVEVLKTYEDISIYYGDIAMVVGDCMNLGCIVIKFYNGYECKFKKDELRKLSELEIMDRGLRKALKSSMCNVDDLVKNDDKIDKIVIRKWEDIEKTNISVTKDGDEYIIYHNLVTSYLKKYDIGKAVKVLNALGGNFEYKPVEVIDTFPKFVDFLVDSRVEYRPSETKSFRYNSVREKYYHLFEIEEKFNVDLKILKG